MKITRKIYLLLVAFVVSQAMAAQTVLTGKVLEKASGEPCRSQRFCAEQR